MTTQPRCERVPTPDGDAFDAASTGGGSKSPMYRAAAAEAAWSRTLAFLAEHLR